MSDEIDSITVVGVRGMDQWEIQDLLDALADQDSWPAFGEGGNGGDGSSGGDQSNPTAEMLAALRNLIAGLSELDSVGDRDANSRFDRDPDSQTAIQIGNDIVYWDSRTNSFWFDQNRNGTVETEFWVTSDGVWYDVNNDGNADTNVGFILLLWLLARLASLPHGQLRGRLR